MGLRCVATMIGVNGRKLDRWIGGYFDNAVRSQGTPRIQIDSRQRTPPRRLANRWEWQY